MLVIMLMIHWVLNFYILFNSLFLLFSNHCRHDTDCGHPPSKMDFDKLEVAKGPFGGNKGLGESRDEEALSFRVPPIPYIQSAPIATPKDRVDNQEPKGRESSDGLMDGKSKLSITTRCWQLSTFMTT